MEVVNDTPFMFVPVPGRIGFPGYSLTLIVKATFDLKADGRCVAAQEQIFPTGDVLYADDTEGAGSIRYESDFACFKPRCDLLLVGKCYTPERTPLPLCQATFGVGRYARTVTVFGERRRQGLMARTGDPAPFTEIDLRYENCYGGPGYDRNPVGKGYGSRKGRGHPLPNVENVKQHLVDAPGLRPKPAGFGPIRNLWPQRTKMMGAYGGGWLKERWPWFAEDFDWSYFNAAPVDMQVDGYLKGDETLYLENLHPQCARYRSALPGIRLRVFTESVDAVSRKSDFQEAPMHLDTLWIDTEVARLVLLWRGVVAVASEDFEEIRQVFITTEPIGKPAASMAAIQLRFSTVKAEKEKMDDIGPIPIDAEPHDDAVDMDAIEKILAQSQQQMHTAMLAVGLEPHPNGNPPIGGERRTDADLIEQFGFSTEAEGQPLTRDDVARRVAAHASLAGEDLSGLDLSRMNLARADFKEAILNGANFEGSILTQAVFCKADLAGVNFGEADLKGALLDDADLTGAWLSRAVLRQAVLKDAVLDQAVLQAADLFECRADGCSFNGSDLRHADFSRASCQNADFANSRMAASKFVETDLSRAGVENAQGVGVDMTAANLTGLRASGRTDLSMGRFMRASAAESIWEQAVLNGADFSYAGLEGANFAGSSLVESSFLCADLKFARLSKAVLCRAGCVSANLFQATLEKADLTETDLRGANLYGAELRDVVLQGTRLEGANLIMTKLAK